MLRVRDAAPGDLSPIEALHRRAWGGSVVVGHGVAYDLNTLPALACVNDEGEVRGALAFHRDGAALEVVSIVAGTPGQGVGTALIEAAKRRTTGRLWLVTTNDNLDALRFYQRRGLRIVGVDRGAVDRARVRKPAIPVVGAYGIELHDELILEWEAGT